MTAPGKSILYCRIELNKERGITVKVEDDKGKIIQTVEMNGTIIRLTCKGDGEDDTSVITQATDGIEMTCKTFKVAAETVTITSTKDTQLKSEEKMNLESTKDMKLKSEAKLAAEATNDFTLDGKNVTASAKSTASISGMDAEVKGTKSLKLDGGMAELTAKQKVEVKGAPIIKVVSTGLLNLEGKATTLDGKMTTLPGSLVKIG